jgi:ketosteroid isomerase-like protein
MTFAALALAGALASSAATPRALIDHLFAAFNRHDAGALQALYAPEAVLTSSDFCQPRTGRDVTRTYSALFRSFPDIQDRIVTVVIEGDRAAVRFVSSSNLQSRAFRMQLVTLLRFKHGRIIEDDTLFDTGGRPCEP